MTGPLAVLDGQTWVPLGQTTVQAYSGPATTVGDGLGLNALTNMALDVHGSAWTLRFQCGS